MTTKSEADKALNKAADKAVKKAVPVTKAQLAKKAKKKEVLASNRAANKVLKPMIKEINVRLEKATKLTDDAYDHRLSAAITLAEAKEKCTEAKFKWKDWCDANITQSFETVRKLTVIGASEDPAKALEDMRGKNKAANKKLRDNKKKVSRETGSLTGPPAQIAMKAFESMAEDDATKLVKKQAKELGFKVVANDKPDPDVFKQMKKLFGSVKLADQMKFLEWATEHTGTTLVVGAAS